MAHSNSTSGSRRSSSPWSEALRATDRALCHRSSSRTTLWFLSLLLTWTATAQSRKDLEKKRDQLDKQIKTTSALISAGEREQRATQRQLELLQAQIRQRQELIGTMNSEVFRVDKEIGATHYTLLASIEVLGKSPPTWISGVLADRWGLTPMFLITAIACLVVGIAGARRLGAERTV